MLRRAGVEDAADVDDAWFAGLEGGDSENDTLIGRAEAHVEDGVAWHAEIFGISEGTNIDGLGVDDGNFVSVVVTEDVAELRFGRGLGRDGGKEGK